ncbi:hypothetical protein MBLNU457_3199t1 [Dothideomycetes sp. NU457]
MSSSASSGGSSGVAFAKEQMASTQDDRDTASSSKVQENLKPEERLDHAGSDAATGGGLADKLGLKGWRMHEDRDFEGMTQPDFIAVNSEEIKKGGKAEVRDSAGEKV